MSLSTWTCRVPCRFGSETSVVASPDLGEVGGEPVYEVAVRPHLEEMGIKPA